MTMRGRLVSVVGAAWLVAISTGVAFAQITTGIVSGSVKDAQGGVIPGATVTLISETRGTGRPRSSATDRRLRLPERHRGHLHDRGDDAGFKTLQALGRHGQSRRSRRRPARSRSKSAARPKPST